MDFVAQSIIALSLHNKIPSTNLHEVQEYAPAVTREQSSHCSLTTFHVVSGRADGPSLDDTITWMQSFGFPITRIAPYSRWLEQLCRQLEGLESSKRQRTVYPILNLWQKQIESKEQAVIHNGEFVKRLAELGVTEEGAGLPVMDEAFIHKCVRDLIAQGIL